MPRRTIEVPLVPRLLRRVEQIIIERGISRRPVIKGDTIDAFGEVGIKQFHIYLDEVIDDTASLTFDARNEEALDILCNLVESELEDLYTEFKEKEEVQKSKGKSIPKETKIESEKKCLACEGTLTDLGIKELAKGLKAKVVVCQGCGRLDFYKE